jgi:quinol monooxygenase YgiN
MVYVVVSTRMKPGKLQEFVDQFRRLAETVRKEKGCVQYVAAVDMETGLPPQTVDKDVVTILEKWESVEALQAHLATPHMADFFEKEKEFVDQTLSLKVLKEA